MGWVALGEFVCVTIVGVILIKALMKNKYFSKLVTFGMSDQALSEQFKNGWWFRYKNQPDFLVRLYFLAFLSKKLRKSIDKVRVIWYNKYVALSNVKYADVAELADALASGASDRKVMWVQVPSSAPRKARFYRAFFFCSSKNKWADTLALRTIFNWYYAKTHYHS